MFEMKSIKTLIAAGLLALFAGGSNAATLTVVDTVPAVDVTQGTLTCVASCVGYTLGGTWSATEAYMFTIQPNSIANETAAVNAITGQSYSGATQVAASGENFSFYSSALYILFKIGGQDPSHFLIMNTSPGMITINWAGLGGIGAGLSHYVEFGAAPVPVPAAGFLLLAALGGLALVRRRQA
jgi:hypothetical protein